MRLVLLGKACKIPVNCVVEDMLIIEERPTAYFVCTVNSAEEGGHK
jgi:hypothetical protein